ncbi:ABC transporter ATP-binding protein, partial [Pleurocapsa sp. CCALA 161]|uniref:ABC transporter ATP-binding protein n=1 Tax=Pleurocapsa sp. CCALA 161 TaxID=2107688 RepID=UPI000D0673CE
PEYINSNVLLQGLYVKLSINSPEKFILYFGILTIIVFYVKSALSFFTQKSIAEFSHSLKGNLSSKLMQSYLSAPYTLHLSRNSADLVQSIVTYTDRFCIGLVLSLLTAISNGVVIIALVTLLILTNAAASLGITVVLLISLLILNPLKDKLAYWGKQGFDASAEIIRILNHGLGGLKETRIIGCEPYFEAQMDSAAKKYSTNMGLASGYSNLPRYVVEAVIISFLIVFAFLFVTFNQDDSQNITSIFGVFAIASIRLLPAAGNTISCISVIRYNIHSLDSIHAELKEAEEFESQNKKLVPAHHSQPQPKLSFQTQIKIENLVYKYPNAKTNALEQVSLTIEKGHSIGLIGKSGSGKTTLVDVLMGLLDPQSGDILVDGISVKDKIRAWQNLIGYVPQSIFLIDDTLERNIAFGVPDNQIDYQKLQAAVNAAQLNEVIERLPMGLNTTVGERGVLLSGGQRQRVGIARALYHEKEILVFDEATAALDNETENLITDATKALSGSKTIIIIAHRLSTIEHCDRIYRLEQGCITQSGNYQTVVLNQ